MAALSKIYNANYLTNADPFQGQELQSAVNLLSEFMIAIRYWDNEIEGLNTTDKRWLDLLAFGYDGKDNDDDDDNVFSIENYDKFFINPSRVLVQTIFLHSLAKEYKGNIQEDRQLQNYFEAAVFDEDIKTPIKMIREKIYKSLSSPKELFNDIAFWGGIKIAEGDIAKIMTEVRLWSFWREQESAIFGQIVADIKRKPACLQNFLQQLKMTCTNPNVLELYISDYQKAPEEIKSKRLEKYKMQIILALPENVLKELKKLGKNDDISAYMGIAKAIQKEYGGLDQLVSRLKAIGSDCPKIKLRNFTFAEVIAKISTMVDGKSENLDVSFLPKSKQELLETLKAEERIKEYNDKIVELEKSLIWLDSLFKFIKKMYLNHLKYGLAIKAFVK